MAAWRYVGYKYQGAERYWTNEVDIAYSNSNLEDSEVDNFPHSSATVDEGVITDKYDGDVMAWIDDWSINRESLDDIR